MSYMELEPELEAPGLAAIRAKVEESIKETLALAYPELQNVDWMPIAWNLSIEAIGYNEKGQKFRAIEMLNPEGQSMSSTLGVSDITKDSYMYDMSDIFTGPEEDED